MLPARTSSCKGCLQTLSKITWMCDWSLKKLIASWYNRFDATKIVMEKNYAWQANFYFLSTFIYFKFIIAIFLQIIFFTTEYFMRKLLYIYIYILLTTSWQGHRYVAFNNLVDNLSCLFSHNSIQDIMKTYLKASR